MRFKIVLFGWVIRDAKTFGERLKIRPISSKRLHDYVSRLYSNRRFGVVIYEMITDRKPHLKIKHGLIKKRDDTINM